MSEHGRECDNRKVVRGESDRHADPYREHPFDHVEHRDRDTYSCSRDASNIRGTNIPTASPAYVATQEQPCKDHAKRNRTGK
ncbi:MAG: hypothetical protein NVS2B16_26450 [Chloroflexota bacterium]